MRKIAFKYLIASVLSLIGLGQNASAYGDKIYYEESSEAMGRAYNVLKKNGYIETPDNEKKRLGAYRNTKNGGIRGDFFTITDKKTINEIIEIYMLVFYENEQKFDIEINFFKKTKGESQGVFMTDEPFVQLKLRRIEK